MSKITTLNHKVHPFRLSTPLHQMSHQDQVRRAASHIGGVRGCCWVC